MSRFAWMLVVTVLVGYTSLLAQDSATMDGDLEALLATYIAEDEPGAVIFVDIDGDAYTAAYGLANLDTVTPVEVDDRFRIASITKPMVATVMLTLVESGDIDLDTPIADYLPTEIVENVENADLATVRQLLQMTSGIADYTASDAFYDAVLDMPTTFWTAEQTLSYIYGERASFAPGEAYEYSNSNYNLAQIIIEAVTGQPLAVLLDELIFTPLGMETCALETEATFATDMVRGYTLIEAGLFEDITAINDGVGLGDGGVVCTAADLAKFPSGLWNEDIIGEDALAEMFDTIDDGEGYYYGLGIEANDTDYGYMIGHSGATSGFQSMMFYLPDENITVTILANNFDAEWLEDALFAAFDFAFEE